MSELPAFIPDESPVTFPGLERRSIRRLLEPLDHLAANSNRFIGASPGHFSLDGRPYSLPRYLYVGPKGGGDVILIGIFATIHGD